MKSSQHNHTKRLKLFFESPILPGKSTVSLFPLSEDIQPRRIYHMAKFKPFHEFQKPPIGFTPESFLDYVETVIPKDHLCRLVFCKFIKMVTCDKWRVEREPLPVTCHSSRLHYFVCGFMGNVKVKVLPFPNSLITHILPLCNSTRRFVSVRPSPVPS